MQVRFQTSSFGEVLSRWLWLLCVHHEESRGCEGVGLRELQMIVSGGYQIRQTVNVAVLQSQVATSVQLEDPADFTSSNACSKPTSATSGWHLRS